MRPQFNVSYNMQEALIPMAIDSLELARKLLDKLIKVIKPEKKYEEVVLEIADETRKLIIKKYSCSKDNIYGVFGKYAFFVSKSQKEKGKKIIAKISQSICKNLHKVVVTGDRFYYYKKGKVNTEATMINEVISKIWKHDRVWRTTFSKIMGHIPQKAIFLIDRDRSASTHEEGGFHSRKNKAGIGVIITKERFKPCRYLAEIKIGKLKFYQCTSSNYSNCLRKWSRCVAKQLKINKTTIEPFIKRDSNLLIIVKDLSKIEKIIIKLLLTPKLFK